MSRAKVIAAVLVFFALLAGASMGAVAKYGFSLELHSNAQE
jgi:hypothetical protein